MRRLPTVLTMLLALAVQPICVSAGTISDLVVFGDSLSDAGNAYQASESTDPAPPYWEGRFSNGPVWVSRYSYLIGVTDPVRSLAGGTDYAYGGAETGFGTSWKNTPNIGEQIHTYLDLDAGTFSSTTQVILWGGANDIFAAYYAGENMFAAVTSAVDNLGQHIETLAGGGATQFLVPNLPPLDLTPIGYELSPLVRSIVNLLCDQFNTGLSTELDRLRSELSVTIEGIDTHGMFLDAIANPSAYGLTNVVDRAMTASEGTDISGYLFWDDVHPTTYGHQILADAIAIPEPGPITLLLSAGLMLVLASLGSSLRLGRDY
jgi:phospholipase/lecithinase/hemolysin